MRREPTVRRVTGHLKLIERRDGPVWYAKTRVPGRSPEQTTRRLAPAHRSRAAQCQRTWACQPEAHRRSDAKQHH
jgi:hypothetical protein